MGLFEFPVLVGPLEDGDGLGEDSAIIGPMRMPGGIPLDDDERELEPELLLCGCVFTCAFKICPSNAATSSASPCFNGRNSTVVSEVETTSNSLIKSLTNRIFSV